LEEHHLTYTYQVDVGFCQLEGIDYLVRRYPNTSALPFKELSNEWVFDGEA
jgi:hypothetical protein